MSKAKQYWLWVEGKHGHATHDLPKLMADDGEMWGRQSSTWESASNHLRRMMKKGYIVRIYEVDA